ncbi:transglutaminase domain-containing protein [Miniimonas arenae]|uniref:Transglutaminase domain-containing protein n=1 Tax=Miniimonas arenae TaxID=676201 RepID=A0A5C5BDH5_9MICO|nr:transglutaminase domain-containing protein [Miniimonas arenae]
MLGAITLLTSAAGFGALLQGGSWWPAAVLTVTAVTVVEEVCRARGLRVVVAVVAVVVAQVAALTLMLSFVSGVTTPAGAGALLAAAGEHIRTSVAPAPVVPALTALVAGALGLLAILVSHLAVRAPALVALPALGVVLVAATFAVGPLPWYALALPAASYLLLLAVGRPRSGAAARGGGTAGADRVAGTVAIGALTVAAALTVTGAATGVGTTGRLDRVAYEGPSLLTNLTGDLLRGSDAPLLRVTGQSAPGYVRTAALTVWTDGVGWSMGDVENDLQPEASPVGVQGDVQVDAETGDVIAFDGEQQPAAYDEEAQVESLGYTGTFLPVREGTVNVATDEPWSYDADLRAWHRAEATNPGAYTIRVDTRVPSEAELDADTVTAGGPLTEVGDLDRAVFRTAVDHTKDATSPYAKAVALQQWFTDPANGFRYSLTVPAGSTGDPLLDFLAERQGYCQQFASAMAVMLRSLDIPARVVVGFGAGTVQSDGSVVISSHDAHAWVEVLFDGAGWVAFDPTPAAAGQAPQTVDGAPVLPVPGSTAQAANPDDLEIPGGAQPVDPANPVGGSEATAGTDVDTAAEVAQAQEAARWRALGVALLALLGGAALVLGPAAARWWRRRTRLRRAARGGPGAVEDVWAELNDLAVDHGEPLDDTASVRGVAALLSRRARLDRDGRARMAALVRASERAWYGGAAEEAGAAGAAGAGGPPLVADAPTAGGADPRELVLAVGQVRQGLDRYEPIGLGARWLPRSLRTDVARRARIRRAEGDPTHAADPPARVVTR